MNQQKLDKAHGYRDLRNMSILPFIDYKSLLEKYVQLVIDAEGCLYLSAPGTKTIFTEEEKSVLRKIEQEYENE